MIVYESETVWSRGCRHVLSPQVTGLSARIIVAGHVTGMSARIVATGHVTGLSARIIATGHGAVGTHCRQRSRGLSRAVIAIAVAIAKDEINHPITLRVFKDKDSSAVRTEISARA